MRELTNKQRRAVDRLVRQVRDRIKACHGHHGRTYVRGQGTYRVVRRAVDRGLLVAAISKNSFWSFVPKELALFLPEHRAEALKQHKALMPTRKQRQRSRP